MRTAGVVAAIAIAASAAACGGKKSENSKKPVADRSLVEQTHKLGNLGVTLALPDGITGGAKDATTLAWTEDLLEVTVKTGTPVAMQNELNDAAAASLTVTRSDQMPDGWWVTASAADGSTTRNRRMVKVGDTQAVTCTAVATWKKPEAKRVDWVESVCKTLAAKPQ